MSIIEPEETPVSVGVLLFIPYRNMEQQVLAAVAADGYDISLAQVRPFQRLNRDGSRLTDLALATQVSKRAAGSWLMSSSAADTSNVARTQEMDEPD